MHRFTQITSQKICSYANRARTCNGTAFPKAYLNSRNSSSVPTSNQSQTPAQSVAPPSSVNPDMIYGVNNATLLYINHGLGSRHLEDLAKQVGDSSTLVPRWQKMMEVFLGTQVHVISGLGYSPDEKGIALFNNHMGVLMQNAEPDVQERLRDEARLLWKSTLSKAFDMELETIMKKEVDVVEAREIMHKISARMQEPEILEKVAKKTGSIVNADPQQEMGLKHTAVQEILVNDVYLGGDPPLVDELGFGDGERGYVLFQCALADFQADPLVSQYIGTAMFRILKVAGLDEAMMAGKKP